MALEDTGSLLTRSTAEGAALLRAAGHLVGRNPDFLASRLIAPRLGAASLIKLPVANRLAPLVVEQVVPGGIVFEQVRTTVMDEVAVREVEAGARQVVLLGAGLDSRAHRLPALRQAAVFEVDHPVTQKYKRSRVAAVLGSRAAPVVYAQCDFERQSIADAVSRAGFDASARAVVVWSGVAPYLPAGAVETTLRWAATLATGSTLVLDHLWQEVVDGDTDDPLAKMLLKRVAQTGEPFRSGYPRDGAREWLAGSGLELTDEIDGEEGMRRFGERPKHVWSFGAILEARPAR